MLTHIINTALSYDPQALAHLKKMHGQSFSLCFTDLNLILYFQVKNEHLSTEIFSKKIADACVSGTLAHIINMIISEQSGSVAMFENHLDIQGNLHVAEAFQILLKELDIDWEEALSEYIGDAPAFYLGHGIQKAKRFAKKVIRNFKSDLKDYITEEKRFTPNKIEVENFYQEIYMLHLEVERLAARIGMLQKDMSKLESVR